jgi:hypothetical protein
LGIGELTGNHCNQECKLLEDSTHPSYFLLGLPVDPPPDRDGAGDGPLPREGSARGIVRGVSLTGASICVAGFVSRPVFILSLSGAVSCEGLLLEFELLGLDVGFPAFGLAEFPSRTGLVTLFACDGRVPGRLVGTLEGLSVEETVDTIGLGAVSSAVT